MSDNSKKQSLTCSYSYLGDGFSKLELEEGVDKSYYLTKPYDIEMPW